MCFAPKVPKVAPPAQYQPMQPVQDAAISAKRSKSRRGLYSAIFTGPGGLVSPPVTTGTAGGTTGG